MLSGRSATLRRADLPVLLQRYGHGTLVVRQRRAIRPIQAPRSGNHFHALPVDQVFGAEQNSSLIS